MRLTARGRTRRGTAGPPAGLGRRSLAGAIDAAVVIVGCVGAGAAVHRCFSGGDRWERAMRHGFDRLERADVERLAATGGAAAALALRHVHSPGSRAAGIRRVDARTGGPETLRGALVRVTLNAVLQRGLRRVAASPRRRLDDERRETGDRVRTADDELAGDPRAGDEMITRLDRASGRGWLVAMIRPLALSQLHPLTALLSPRRQTVIERIAGVAVIRDPRH